MIVRELITLLSFETDDASVQRAEQRVKALANKMQQVGRQMTTFVTLPLTALAVGFVKAASDAEEVNQKFSVVFQDVANEARETSKTLQDEFFLSQKSTEELLSSTGDLLTGFGFTGEEALKMSKDVLALGSDLASFSNVQGGASEAVRRFNSGIVGNIEGLRSMGIVIRQDTKQFKDRVAVLQRSRNITIQQAKAITIMEEAARQSFNAIGDVQRTQESLANQTRFLKEDFIELAVTWGKLLIPIASKLVGMVRGVIQAFTGLSTSGKVIIIALSAVAAAIGPVLLGTSLLIKAFVFVRAQALLAAGAISGFNFSLLLIPALITAAIVLLALFIDELITWVSGGDSLIGDFIGSWENFRDKFLEIWNSVVGFLKVVVDVIKNLFVGWVDFILALMGDRLVDGIKAAFTGLVNFIKGLGPVIQSAFGFVLDGLKNHPVVKLLLGAVKLGAGVAGKVAGALPDVGGAIVESSAAFAAGGGAAAGAGLRADLASASQKSTQFISISSKNEITVPAGTPDQQRSVIETDVKSMVREENQRAINEVVNATR